MVHLFTSCDGCDNKADCILKTDLTNFYEGIRDTANMYGVSIVNNVSVKVSCNRYQTDYGKGGGM